MADRIDGKKFEPWSIAEKVAQNLQVSTWQQKCEEEERTARWAHIFAKIEPNREVITDVTGALMSVTSGSVSPHYLFGLVLAMWTYGYADALSALADEDVTLWEGKPLDGFPNWEDEVADMPRSMPNTEKRDEPPPETAGSAATPPTPPTTPPTNTQLPVPIGGDDGYYTGYDG